ncbi:MAG: alkaline phosphatase family protein [Chloroflexi bacterium]|nr:alkaline phosphatase family protein [Chloroflexota bacterium]MCI0575011.1 alkaline phosphatase family protein [Chloroflexota bacterium]MCI0727688.1 alkaline phosphatase family protein [Chloroflexota bacterium]
MWTERPPRTLVVGLDAACWEYVTPLLAAGRLPALQRLMAEGTWGALHSTLPALTPTAWASIVTGKNPGKHGVFDMLWRRPGTYEFQPTSSAVRVGTPFWQHLNARGIRVGLVNVPFTHPPGEIDGFIVCGFGTPESVANVAGPAGLASPAGALAWIQERFGDYTPRGRLKELRKTTSLDKLLADEREHQARQAQIASGLAQLYQVDVLVINLMLLDHVNHYATRPDQIEAAIGDTDSDLDHLLSAFRPDHTLLFSDHGSRRVRGDFLLHQWLLDGGYVARPERRPAERAAALHTALVQSSQAQRRRGIVEKAGRRLRREVLLRLPGPAAGRLWRQVEMTVPFAHQYVKLADDLDYHCTRLFPGSTYSGNLYLNLAGREPAGVVSPEERAALQAELARRLADISDPENGRPLFSAVYTPEQLYQGPAVAHAPDIILDGYDTPWNAKLIYPGLISRPTLNRYFLEQHGDAGWHSKEGLFVFAGPAFRQGPAARERQVMDLPATLLYLYGVPIPEDYDGQVMGETLAGGFLDRRPVTFQPGDRETALPFEASYSADESAEVLEHLRALGYVD